MKKAFILICSISIAFVAGWVLSRHLVLKQYPPDVVKFISEWNEHMEPMSSSERKNLVRTMQKNLNIISTEFDYQALHEGMSARFFQLALNKGGEAEARILVDKQLQKFRDRYNKGLNLPEGSMKLATALNESIEQRQ